MTDTEIRTRINQLDRPLFSEDLYMLEQQATDPELKNEIHWMAHWRWKEENCDEDYS